MFMSLADLIDALPEYAEDQARHRSPAETVLSGSRSEDVFWLVPMRQARGLSFLRWSTSGARIIPEACTTRENGRAIAMNVYFQTVNLLEPQLPEDASDLVWPRSPIWNRQIDFELWSLAVSAVNGCGACLNAHEANYALTMYRLIAFWLRCASLRLSQQPAPY
jgi:alkyl hydroperoxide reductase subunit D